MPTSAIPLDTLSERIAQQEAELETLRRDYDARQTQLAGLTQRKEQLAVDLQQVDSQIQALSQGTADRQSAGKTVSSPARTKSTSISVTLGEFIATLVQQAGEPISIRQLADEIGRRKYPTRSKDIPGLVNNRVADLVKKGTLKRAKNKPGFVYSTARNGQPAATRRSDSGSVRTAHTGQPPLRVVLINILRQSKRPLGVSELAQRILETGYSSNSKNFPNVVAAMLGKLDSDVKNVRGKGYTLKKR